MVVVSFLSASQPTTVLTGVALIAVGLATLRMWMLRINGRLPSSSLIVVGRAALTLAVVIGFARTVPEISGALGLK